MSRKRFPHPIVGLWPWPTLYSRVGSFRTFWTTPRLTAARITAGCKSPVVMFTLARFGCGSAAGLFFLTGPPFTSMTAPLRTRWPAAEFHPGKGTASSTSSANVPSRASGVGITKNLEARSGSESLWCPFARERRPKCHARTIELVGHSG